MEKKTTMDSVVVGGETHHHHYPSVPEATEFAQNVSAVGGAVLGLGLAAAATAAAYCFVKEAVNNSPSASAAGTEFAEEYFSKL